MVGTKANVKTYCSGKTLTCLGGEKCSVCGGTGLHKKVAIGDLFSLKKTGSSMTYKCWCFLHDEYENASWSVDASYTYCAKCGQYKELYPGTTPYWGILYYRMYHQSAAVRFSDNTMVFATGSDGIFPSEMDHPCAKCRKFWKTTLYCTWKSS